MNFYHNVLIHLPLYNSPNRVSSLDYLEPITRAAVQAIMAESAQAGMPLICFETYRSPLRQKQLYLEGATQLEAIGCHSFGVAADLVKDLKGDPSWAGSFAFLGPLAKKHGLVWGGTWAGFTDLCHVQRVRVIDQPRLFDASFYPDENYNPLLEV